MDSNSTLLLIVATYNEIDNLPRLVGQVDELLPHAKILVIDDASPDGTGNWCEQAIEKYPQLTVVHREGKLGLGSATKVGFENALAGDYQLVATMDADLSHEPKSLAEMVAVMVSPEHQPIGVMLGSRYVKGGGTEGWPWFRRVASKVVNGFRAFDVGPLKRKITVVHSEFIEKTALEKLDLAELRSNDFAYLEEILWRLKKSGVQFDEYPIVFKNRELGRSKTSAILGLKVFWQITQMGLGFWK